MRLIEQSNKKMLWIHVVFVSLFCVLILGRYGFRALEEKSFFNLLLNESLGPMQDGISSTKNSIEEIFNNYIYLTETQKENDLLVKRVSELEQRIFDLSSLETENTRLKNLLNFSETLNYKKILGRVVSWDTSNRYQKLRINKGSNDLVRLNSVVVNSDGLIGKVINVSPNYSEVSTILDFRNRVDVLFQKTRTHGILEGLNQNLSRVKYVKNSEPILENEFLVTSGMGAIYPKNIKVGFVVNQKSKDYDLTREVFVQPFVDFTKLEEVIILIKGINE